jgi:integrase
MEHIQKSAYTQPKLVHYDFDLSKKWFVYFRYNGKVFKHWAGINKHKSKAARLKEAIATRNALIIALEKGWSPIKDEPQKVRTIHKAVKDMYDIKKGSLRRKSQRTYSDIVNMFCGWLEDKAYSHLFPGNFTPVLAQSYLDHLIKDKGYSGKTHNGQLGILKTVFNMLVKRDIIVKNPFQGIAELPEISVMNEPFTDSERALMIDYLQKHNKRLYYAVSFIYFCFLRRSEIIGLKVGYINFEKHTINIPAEVSKNRKSESVTIPRAFEPILLEMELGKYDLEDYIFGRYFKTCSRRIARADNMSSSITRIKNELGIKGNKGLYSFKHMGVIQLYKATSDPYLVSRQCRHSSLQMTMIYLRSLGLTVDEGIRRADFTY